MNYWLARQAARTPVIDFANIDWSKMPIWGQTPPGKAVLHYDEEGRPNLSLRLKDEEPLVKT